MSPFFKNGDLSGTLLLIVIERQDQLLPSLVIHRGHLLLKFKGRANTVMSDIRVPNLKHLQIPASAEDHIHQTYTGDSSPLKPPTRSDSGKLSCLGPLRPQESHL